MKKTLFPSVIALTMSIASNASASSFEITDFRFSLQDPAFGDWQTPTGGQPINPTQYGTLVEGVYQGSNSTNELVNFTFFGIETHVYTSSMNQGSLNTPAGSILGGPAPTIDLNLLTADMSSWMVEWAGTEFNQGNNTNFGACSVNPNFSLLSSIATVTDNNNGTYAVNWNSCIEGGAFNGRIGHWQLDVVSAVPVPAAVWLFGSGLLGLIGVAKRKKA